MSFQIMDQNIRMWNADYKSDSVKSTYVSEVFLEHSLECGIYSIHFLCTSALNVSIPNQPGEPPFHYQRWLGYIVFPELDRKSNDRASI